MIKTLCSYIYNSYYGFVETKCYVCNYPFMIKKEYNNKKIFCGIYCANKDSYKL